MFNVGFHYYLWEVFGLPFLKIKDMRILKKVIVVFILGVFVTSCAINKPTYTPGTDKNEYNKKLVKYYEKSQEKYKN